jgi:hypothetical protein
MWQNDKKPSVFMSSRCFGLRGPHIVTKRDSVGWTFILERGGARALGHYPDPYSHCDFLAV